MPVRPKNKAKFAKINFYPHHSIVHVFVSVFSESNHLFMRVIAEIKNHKKKHQ